MSNVLDPDGAVHADINRDPSMLTLCDEMADGCWEVTTATRVTCDACRIKISAAQDEAEAANAVDPISREMQMVAVAVFGEKLDARTPGDRAAVRRLADAIARDVYPDSPRTRAQFVRMCLDEPVTEDV